MRAAPREIPLVLGNIRQELISEREQLRRKIRRCTDINHIQITTGAGGGNFKGKGPQEEVLFLLSRTIKSLWTEFKGLERPFLVRDPRRAEEIARGDFWGDGDVDEKDRRPQLDEEKLGSDGATYYRTDFGHRFIWWQNKGDVTKLADQVQRIQIRRIERDVWETEQLVRLVLGRMVGVGGGGGEESDDSGSSSGPDGGRPGGGGGGRGGVRKRRRSARVAEQQRKRVSSRSGSLSGGAAPRKEMVVERETVKVRGDTTRDSGTERERERPAPRRRRDSVDRDRERDRERERPPPRPRERRGSTTTYEVLRPGDQDSAFEIIRPGERGSGYEVIRPGERRAGYVERDRRRDGERY